MANKPNPANFSPTVPDFPEIGAYQPIYGKFDLTTYVQGASDYEIMAFLVQCYNATLKGYSDVTKLSKDTVTAYNQLQAWVNTWFDNLDVQTEINDKLQEMYENGSLADAITQSNAVEQYFNSPEGTQSVSKATADKLDSMTADGTLASVVAATNKIPDAVSQYLNTDDGKQNLSDATAKQVPEAVNQYLNTANGVHTISNATVNKIDSMAADGSLADVVAKTNQIPNAVKQYLDSVDGSKKLSDATAAKIELMAASGELGTVIGQTTDLQKTTTDWLTANVTPVGSAVVVDKSLTVEGAAADAKATGQIKKEVETQLFTGEDVNDITLINTGVYDIPAGCRNLPKEKINTEFWGVMYVTNKVFHRQGYVLQTIMFQDGYEYSRWVNDTATNFGEWVNLNSTRKFEGTDLNVRDLTFAGVYVIKSGTINTPNDSYDGRWILYVTSNVFNEYGYFYQIITNQYSKMYGRTVNDEGKPVVSWTPIANPSDILKATPFNGTDLNDIALVTSGTYSILPNCKNSPPDSVRKGWNGVLYVTSNVFNQNNYALQTIVYQDGVRYSRYASMQADSFGEWSTGIGRGTIKWCAFGDSITAGQLRTNSYLDLTSDIIGASYTNKAVGATGFLVNDGGNICVNYIKQTDLSGFDIVTIAYGINDYRANKPLGTENDTAGVSTICGQLIESIKYVGETYPDAKLIVLTPINEVEVGTVNTDYALTVQNSAGYTLLDLIEKLTLICDKYNVPVVNMHEIIGWTRYNIKNYLGDNIHPNEKGYYSFARALAATLPFKK